MQKGEEFAAWWGENCELLVTVISKVKIVSPCSQVKNEDFSRGQVKTAI